MIDPKTWRQPTQEQQDHALLVHVEIIEAFNRMRAEGMEAEVLLAGAGAAVADLVTTVWGNQAVPKWFQGQADMASELIQGARH